MSEGSLTSEPIEAASAGTKDDRRMVEGWSKDDRRMIERSPTLTLPLYLSAYGEGRSIRRGANAALVKYE